MLLRVTVSVLFLTLFIQCIEGFERVIVVDESVVHDDIFATGALDNASIPSTLGNLCCIYGNCSCPSLYSALTDLTSNVLINITTDVELFSVIKLLDLANIIIIGHKNPTVNCNNSGGLHFISCHNCTIEGIEWEGCGNVLYDNENVNPVLKFSNSSNIVIENCSFQHSIGQAVVLSGVSEGVNITHCNFSNNTQYEGHGAAIHYSSNILLNSPFSFTINDCNFSYNKRAQSIVYFGQSSLKLHECLYLQNSKFYRNKGVPVYLTYQELYINGNITFYRNVAENGGGIFISDYSSVIFHKNATINFTDNKAKQDGGAIFLTNHSTILFNDHSTNNQLVGITVTFHNNRVNRFGNDIYAHNSSVIFSSAAMVAFNGFMRNSSAVYFQHYSTVVHGGNSTVTFNNNHNVGNDGGALYIDDYSTVTFKENSTVALNNNRAKYGGAAKISNSSITFEGNSRVTFNNNGAIINGGNMFINNHSVVTFRGNSTVAFNNSSARYGGAWKISDSTIIFKEYSTVTFNNNRGSKHDGAINVFNFSNVTFEGYSTVTFYNNHGKINCGAMLVYKYANVIFKGNSTVTFINNSAEYGGAMVIQSHSTVTYKGKSTVTFHNNNANGYGGALYIDDRSTVTFKGNSAITFNINRANSHGGAVHIKSHSNVSFTENTTVTFSNNTADSDGGVVHNSDYSNVIFKGNSTVTFNNNMADDNGGAVSVDYYSAVRCEENSTITFRNNTAVNGGALFIDDHSNFILKGKSTLEACNNKVHDNGGVMYVAQSAVQFKGNSVTIIFAYNKAKLGGTIFVKSSQITNEGNCSVQYTNNTAIQDGGAIYLSYDSHFEHRDNFNAIFYNNIAGEYGGAIYILLEDSIINLNSTNIHFKDNTAGIINTSVYISMPKSCDSSCLVNINNTSRATSPNKLMLYSPAKCINFNNKFKSCDMYYVNNIMLGQEITFVACVLDYYDQPTEPAEFLVTGMNHQDYKISGSKYISVSCNHTTQGISIIGNLSKNSYNYSIIISKYAVRFSEFKIISVNLTVELTQCHLGFWYSSKKSQKCECYNTNNIISCTGSNSTIKRGYWFGRISETPTVTLCPDDYCNFTCCQITNGIYHLSPVRANQCRSHRSGIACGNCEEGYTLSFDSPECIEVSKCTIGQMILVIALSLLYWIVVVVVVFVMMYFKIPIGSLYAIIFYYSVVDILLSQVLFISNGLYTTVNIMSSLAKLTPRFLGQLCLVRNMSGIDQQFIHYVHPAVVLFILIMISKLAKKSRRVSSFVSRGIIHFICFLLLLSYTSVATTSLLLMRTLEFTDIDKVYTYLSPDIEYFHGRHLAYIIIAIIFTVIIVIGLPLLLLLEPFLNSKINFVKIKPLLDQFQCCYKDKYRCFAAYYMICRLVIIFFYIFNDFITTQFLLISSCALMELIHVMVRPYANTIHNIFDGIVLQLIVIISVLPVVEFIGNYNEIMILVITYILVILPLPSFITIKCWINRNNIRNAFKDCIVKCLHKYSAMSTDDTMEPHEINEIVNKTRNERLVNTDQKCEGHQQNLMWCREPFLEELTEIEALDDIRNLRSLATAKTTIYTAKD